jgi:uncharacterized iron-regulated membrane protein
METRLVIAYSLIFLMALAAAGILLYLSRHRRAAWLRHRAAARLRQADRTAGAAGRGC